MIRNGSVSEETMNYETPKYCADMAMFSSQTKCCHFSGNKQMPQMKTPKFITCIESAKITKLPD